MQMQMEIQQQPIKKKNRSQEMTTSFTRFTHVRIKYVTNERDKGPVVAFQFFSYFSSIFVVTSSNAVDKKHATVY